MWGFGVSGKRTLDMGAIVMLENSGYRSRLQNTIVPYSTEEKGFTRTWTMLSTRRIKKTTGAVERPVSTAAGGGGGGCGGGRWRPVWQWLVNYAAVQCDRCVQVQLTKLKGQYNQSFKKILRGGTPLKSFPIKLFLSGVVNFNRCE